MGAVQGLEPDEEFTFRLYESGDCSALNDQGREEQSNDPSAPRAGSSDGRLGAVDLVAIRSNHAGVAHVDTTAPGRTIGGDTTSDVLDWTMAVHEPSGTAQRPAGGGRMIACGVVVPTAPAAH